MDKINVFLGVFLSIILLCLLVLFYYHQITLFISQFTMKVLSPIFHENVLAIESSDFLKWFGPVYYLSLPGRFPSIVFIWLNLLITLISLFLLSSVVKTRPGDGQLVTKRIFPARQNAAKEPACVEAFEFTDFAPGFRFNHPYIGGIG